MKATRRMFLAWTNSTEERRSAARIQLRCSLEVQADDRMISATTDNVSRTGVSLYSKEPLPCIGSSINFTIEFPAELTLSTPLTVLCEATIVRKWQFPWRAYGAGVHIFHYEFLTNEMLH